MADVLSGIWKIVKGKVTLTVTFEVVDDPADGSDHRSFLKPIDVWYVALNAPPTITPDIIRANGIMISNITKNTPRELRLASFNDTPGKHATLFVLAEPTSDWQALYEPHQTEAKIATGKNFNVPVFVTRKQPPKPSNKSGGAAKPGKLIL